jgi:hypothetical protein
MYWRKRGDDLEAESKKQKVELQTPIVDLLPIQNSMYL